MTAPTWRAIRWLSSALVTTSPAPTALLAPGFEPGTYGLQTVGRKGYDGLAIALVVADP